MAALMGAAATDHLFLDGGHTIDFTNKAFEVLDHLGWDQAGEVLTTLAHETARAGRAEETGEWRHPDDIAVLLKGLQEQPGAAGDGKRGPKAVDGAVDAEAVDGLAWAVLGDDPDEIVAALDQSGGGGGQRRGAGPGGGLRRRAAADPLPHPERPRGLGRRPPRASRPPTPSTRWWAGTPRPSWCAAFTRGR